MESHFEPTDLANADGGARVSLRRQSGRRAGARRRLPSAPEPVYVDRAMWEKIVLNLVSNAFKFTFEGRVSVGLHRRGSTLELTVSDSGTGIPEPELPRLFERFHRVEGARARSLEGTGIGLALVWELANAHGGKVRVASEVGRGARSASQSRRAPRTCPGPNRRRRGVAGEASVSAIAVEAAQWSRTTRSSRPARR